MKLYKRIEKLARTVRYYIKGLFTPVQHMILASQKELTEANVFKIWNVYAIVTYIAQNVATLPFRQYEKKANNEDPVEIQTPESNIIFNRPNIHDSGVAMWRLLIAYLMVNGNCYARKIEGYKLTELWPLESHNVTPKAGVDRPIGYYEYQKKVGKDIIPPEEMLHIRTINLESRISGMSIFDAAKRVINLQESTIKWNQAIMDNHGASEGAWVTETVMTDNQREDLMKQVKIAKADYDLKGEPLLYGGGLKWVPFALKPKDVDWILSDKMSLRKICAVCHFPPELLGDGENKTHSNVKEAKTMLYNDTIIPYGQEICTSLNHFLHPDGRIYYGIDKNQIEAIQTNILDKANAVKGLPVIRVDDALKMLGFAPLGDDKGGDVVLISQGYMPSDQALANFDLPPAGDE